jgi:bacteriochlorophyllide a dehydrogenase
MFMKSKVVESKVVESKVVESKVVESKVVMSKAVVFYAPEQLELREVELREMNPDDVLIETYWTSVSAGTEKMLFQGKLPAMPMTEYPVIPGYETVGKVIQRGSDVPEWLDNHFVYVAGSLGYKHVNAAWGGASQLIVSPYHKTTRLDGLREPALGLALPLSATALHAVDLAKVYGKKVLVLGQGAVGLLVTSLAKHFGATQVVATDLNDERLKFSTADVTINTSREKISDVVGVGTLFESIIDCTGNMHAIEQSFSSAAMKATIVLGGFYQRLDFAYHVAFMKELTFHAAKQWSIGDLERARDLIGRDKLDVKKIFTHQSSAYNGIAHAYDTAFNDAACLKMVLNWKAD